MSNSARKLAANVFNFEEHIFEEHIMGPPFFVRTELNSQTKGWSKLISVHGLTSIHALTSLHLLTCDSGRAEESVVSLPVALWLSFICRSYNGAMVVLSTEFARLVRSVIPLPSHWL